MPVLRACPGCRGLRSAVNVKLLLSTRKYSVDQRLVGFGQGYLKVEASNPMGYGFLGRVAGAEVVPNIPRS